MAGGSVVLAKSAVCILIGNVINSCLPVPLCDIDKIKNGDALEVDRKVGTVREPTNEVEFSLSKLPDAMLKILDVGRLISYTIKYGDIDF